MAITSHDDIAEFRTGEGTSPERDEPRRATTRDGATGGRARREDHTAEQEYRDTREVPVGGVWVLCRKRSSGDVETVRAFDDEIRARADLELVESVSEDEFWLAAVPLVMTPESGSARAANSISRVQALALTWLAQGAEAEASVPLDDPVVVSPRHVRGFVSVPSHEWQEMEDRGWVRDGMITPDGAAKVGEARRRASRD